MKRIKRSETAAELELCATSSQLVQILWVLEHSSFRSANITDTVDTTLFKNKNTSRPNGLIRALQLLLTLSLICLKAV